MAIKSFTKGTALAVLVVLAFGLERAQATPLTTDPVETIPDAIKSNFNIDATVQQSVLSLGKLPRTKIQETIKVDTKAAPDQGQAVPGSSSFSHLPSFSRESSGETSSLGTGADGITPLPGGRDSLLTREQIEPDSMQVGSFRASSSDAPTNYFAEAMPNAQVAPPQSSALDGNAEASRAMNPEPVIPPIIPEANGSVTFSNLGAPSLSGADNAAVSDEAADGVVLSASNDAVVTVDPAGSNINIPDLVDGNDAPLDAHQALMELEIRHALLDVRDTLSDIREVVTDNTLVNATRSTVEPGVRSPGTEDSDGERSLSSNYAADDQSQFANKIIHEITMVSIFVRDYFWLFALIALVALMLRWTLKRH